MKTDALTKQRGLRTAVSALTLNIDPAVVGLVGAKRRRQVDPHEYDASAVSDNLAVA